jgi:hypothetical protein
MVDNKMEVSPVKAALLPLLPDSNTLSIRQIKESEEQETNGVIEKAAMTIPAVLSSDAGMQ